MTTKLRNTDPVAPATSAPFHVLCGGITYTDDRRVLLICLFGATGSFKRCWAAFRNRIAGPSQRAMQTRHGRGRPAVTGATVQNVPQRFLASPANSLRCLQRETGITYSSCLRAARRRRIRTYSVNAVRNFKLLTCRKEGPTSGGFKHLLHKNLTSCL
jgi:hypothetical protein